jgi:hypothetical protein
MWKQNQDEANDEDQTQLSQVLLCLPKYVESTYYRYNYIPQTCVYIVIIIYDSLCNFVYKTSN